MYIQDPDLTPSPHAAPLFHSSSMILLSALLTHQARDKSPVILHIPRPFNPRPCFPDMAPLIHVGGCATQDGVTLPGPVWGLSQVEEERGRAVRMTWGLLCGEVIKGKVYRLISKYEAICVGCTQHSLASSTKE